MGDERSAQSRGRVEGDAPRIHLGAFGKHPAWNDHIDDQGLSTPELADTKRVLYVEGMSGNIDAGTWEALASADRIEEFQHQFVRKIRGGVIVGRFWASSDGKGRTKYPMVVCAQIMGADLAWACREGMSELFRLEAACRAATTQEEVIAAIDRSRSALRRESGEATSVRPLSRTVTSQLADEPALGPNRLGMHRLLYQFDRDMAAFRPASGSTATRMAGTSPRAQLARVPRVSGSVEDSMALWLRFCDEHVAESVPVWVFAPERFDWVDVIIGEPTQKLLACIKTGPGVVPPTTEVPYTLDDEFIAKADALIARTPADLASQRPARGLREAAESARGALSDVIARGAVGKRLPVKAIATSVAGVAVLVIAAVLLPRACSSTTGSGGPSTKADPSPRPEEVVGPLSPEAIAIWERWCDDHHWLREVSLALGSSATERNDLRAVLSGVDDPATDPRRFAGRPGASFAALRSDPPDALGTPRGLSEAREAAAKVSAMRGGLSAGRWPLRGALVAVHQASERHAWSGIEAYLGGLDSSLSSARPSEVADGIRELIRIAEPLAAITGSLREIEAQQEVFASTQVPVLQRFPELLRGPLAPPAASGAAALRGVSLALREIEATAGRVRECLELTWPGVDKVYFARHARLGWSPDEAIDRMVVENWVAQASRQEFQRLDPQSDPRAVLEGVIAGLERMIQSVRATGVEGMEEELRSWMGRVQDLRHRQAAISDRAWVVAERDQVMAETQQVRREAASIEAGLQTMIAMAAASYAEFIARNDERSGITGGASDAVDEAWRARWAELKTMFPSEAAYGALSDRTRRLETDLRRIAQDIGAEDMPEALPVAAAMLYAARRDAAVRSAIAATPWVNGLYQTESADAVQARVQARDEFARWREGVGSLLTDVAFVNRALDQGHSLDAEIGGRGVREVAASIERSEHFREVRTAIDEAWDRVLAVRGIAESDDSDRLLAEGRGTTDRAIALACWRRLGAMSRWPDGLREFRQDDALMQRVQLLIRQIEDPSIRSELQNELVSGTGQRWARAVERERDRHNFAELISVRPNGFEPTFSPRVRLNIVVLHTIEGLRAREGSDERAVQVFLREMTEAIAGIGAAPDAGQAQQWIDDLRFLAELDLDEAPAADLSEFGPGAKGWSAQEFDDGRRVVYMSPGRGEQIEFLRVEVSSGVVYIAAEELSIDVANAVMQNLSRWEALAGVWQPLHDSMQGRARPQGAPYSWRWQSTRTAIEPSDRWVGAELLPRSRTRPSQPGTFYHPEIVVAAPTGKAPLNDLNGQAAALLASEIGCRLPTSMEWLAAWEQWGASGPANVRDVTWSKQLDHVLARDAIEYPDEAMFIPSEMRASVPTGRNATAGSATNDGVLWFAPIDSCGGPLRHGLGNVWELLDDGSPGEPQFKVIGGSALSAPEVPPLQAYDLRRERTSAADIGMRLAFDLGGLEVGRPFRSGVRRLLDGAPFAAP